MGRDYLARCRSIRVRDGKSCEMTRQRTSESFRIRLRFGVVPERDLLHHCRTAQASVKWTLIIAFGNTVRSQLEVNERICRKTPREDSVSPQEKSGRSDLSGSHARS